MAEGEDHQWREGAPATDRRTVTFSDDIFDLILQEVKTCHHSGRVSTRMILTLKRVRVSPSGVKKIRHFNGLCLSKSQPYLTKSYVIMFNFMGDAEK